MRTGEIIMTQYEYHYFDKKILVQSIDEKMPLLKKLDGY